MKRIRQTISILMAILLMTAIMTACDNEEEQVIFDAGEYGQINPTTSQSVIANEGYHFLGWSDPIVEGKKTTYKAQYSKAEYYLSENSEQYYDEEAEAYIFPQDTSDVIIYIVRKVINLQTQKETTETIMVGEHFQGKAEPETNAFWFNPGVGCGVQIMPYVFEFDSVITFSLDDSFYNTKKEFKLHCIRNRIAAESLTISAWYSGKIEVSKSNSCRFESETLPANASFKDCDYQIVGIIRDGLNMSLDSITEIAYIDGFFVRITDQAQVGDIIRVQANNVRDPQIKSNIVDVTVVD